MKRKPIDISMVKLANGKYAFYADSHKEKGTKFLYFEMDGVSEDDVFRAAVWTVCEFPVDKFFLHPIYCKYIGVLCRIACKYDALPTVPWAKVEPVAEEYFDRKYS